MGFFGLCQMVGKGPMRERERIGAESDMFCGKEVRRRDETLPAVMLSFAV